MNRLQSEKSPYLLQHAANPIDWYPWCDAAFTKAREEHKPIFLSIGYSTCHWCHVMSQESFDDPEVAEVLNRDYVCIKVDREERPDIDAIYMTVCQALTGSGGWPLTILMTPEQKPFWAGTYLPKTTRYGALGLLQLLTIVRQKWNTDYEQLHELSEKLTALVQPPQMAQHAPSEPSIALLEQALGLFESMYDKQWGGFGAAPKFPSAHNLIFLLQFYNWENNSAARDMAEHTLTQMFRGGIFDHIGGGFSRYSTDAQWQIPHFEKMLYDNALLAYAYLTAYEIGHRPLFRRISERTLDYVLAELTHPQGGFYCGQDADSDGIEGKYYGLTRDEIDTVLGNEDGAQFCKWFSVEPHGNFEGKSIPNLIHNRNFESPNAHMDALCEKLYAYRFSRTTLRRDEKVLTSWNALMILAFTKAGTVLHRPDYLQAAQKAEHFLFQHMLRRDHRLFVRWYEGDAAHEGQLEDYAYYALALLELYQSTLELPYLQRAHSLAEKILALFPDTQGGGFFRNAVDAPQLIGRPKETYDGALPSGNAVAAIVLDRMARLTGERKWQISRDTQMRFLATAAREYPAGYSMSLLAFMGVLYPTQELICTTPDSHAPTELLEWIRNNNAANLTVILKCQGHEQELAQIAPYTADYPITRRSTQYYLCQNHVCSAPLEEIALLHAPRGSMPPHS